MPITGGSLTFGYQIGCAVDVSNGLTLGLGFSIGPNASVTISQFPGATIGGQASVNPNISTTLKPGAIATVAFGSKPLAASRGSITADQVEIKVDACAGPVTIRSFATARMRIRRHSTGQSARITPRLRRSTESRSRSPKFRT